MPYLMWHPDLIVYPYSNLMSIKIFLYVHADVCIYLYSNLKTKCPYLCVYVYMYTGKYIYTHLHVVYMYVSKQTFALKTDTELGSL